MPSSIHAEALGEAVAPDLDQRCLCVGKRRHDQNRDGNAYKSHATDRQPNGKMPHSRILSLRHGIGNDHA